MFATIAKAAGKNLTVASFTRAGEGLHDVVFPGVGSPVSFDGKAYAIGNVYRRATAPPRANSCRGTPRKPLAGAHRRPRRPPFPLSEPERTLLNAARPWAVRPRWRRGRRSWRPRRAAWCDRRLPARVRGCVRPGSPGEQTVGPGTPHHRGTRFERDGPHGVGTTADASVDEDLHLVADGSHHIGKSGEGRGNAVELAAAVVRDDDRIGAGSRAFLASSGVRMPLTATGPPNWSFSRATSSHRGGAPIQRSRASVPTSVALRAEAQRVHKIEPEPIEGQVEKPTRADSHVGRHLGTVRGSRRSGGDNP